MTVYLRLAVVAPLLVLLVLVGGGPASASCVADPQPSAHAFTGTVVSTTADGRVAQVKTDDRRVVEVRGTPNAAAMTSVDRTYRVGARYEFHPVNSGSPYEDNVCTVTHEVAALPAVSGATALGDEAPAHETDGLPDLGWLELGGWTIAALGASAAAFPWMIDRRRTHFRRSG